MNLSPTELERLVIFNAAQFARRNMDHGIRLSHPEAVAFITDEAMLMARANVPLEEIRERVGMLLSAQQVESGVPAMLPLIMVELPLDEGTKLLTVYDPIPQAENDIVPGEIVAKDALELPFSDDDVVQVQVVNEGDRDVQVRSFTHFFEVNRALSFDREAAYGMRLAIAAGGGMRFEPGIPQEVRLVPIGGDRVVMGQAGLVEGPLDDPAIRARAFERARARGYIRRQS